MLIQSIEVTAEDVAALQDVFADELARGWMPRPAEIEDALGLIRSRRTTLTESLDQLIAL